ncbi:hypothetical protein Ae717Ps2_6165c [Pseudonocardia sp. Ae717_Ps2]|nr:hypothetical protein Ae717Ps2_6165c [Pseudonocardia sp. Ae717_Ps2]
MQRCCDSNMAFLSLKCVWRDRAGGVWRKDPGDLALATLPRPADIDGLAQPRVIPVIRPSGE